MEKNIMHSLWEHIKTGHIYVAMGYVSNATNGYEGQQMVIYARVATGEEFVRDEKEFKEKFRPHEVE